MSRNNKGTSQIPKLSFRDLQLQIEEFRKKRDDLNQRTKDLINELQEIDNQIEAKLNVAKENYQKKRDYWNSKVKKLKEKKNEYKKIFDGFIEEKKTIIKENNSEGESKKVLSVKQIERKIENLERRIEIDNLDIPEENAIIDKIKELAQIKQEYLSEQQNSELFKLEKKIKIVKLNLNKIYEQLNKWSNKSQNYHAKMHEMYQSVNELREKKKSLEEELIGNKKAADEYHEQFLKVMNQKKKVTRGKKVQKFERPIKKSYKVNNKRMEELERLKEEKLAEALEKQKAGKKLNLYEARLILEQFKG
jgi:uncharacterized coiled-coil DUF342 family protein